MKQSTRSLTLKLCIVLSLAIAALPAAAQSESPASPLVSTLADQTGVAVTVYNVNLGLVKDRRNIRPGQGVGELRFMDVAAQIIPASVSIKALADPGSFRVLEQNYEYDLLNPQKLMEKYVGKDVRLYQKNPYTEREEVVTATLLSANNGTVFKIGDDVTFNHPGRIIFPGLPEGLIPKPTLVWLLDNRLAEPREVEASYLTNGITWRADYVVILNEQDTRASLSAWVTIDNRSGATYRNAALKLVAGDVNRVREEPKGRDRLMGVSKAVMAPAPQFREEGFFEYHIYTLQRPATIRDNQTKQISLATADAIPVRKEFLFKGTDSYFYGLYSETEGKQKVGVYVEMANKKENNLGIPLPKGTIRVYKLDGDGSLQFIGEDAIDHTARDEKIRLKLGDAFDVTGERRQTDWKKIASDTYEAAFEVTLRNHKKEDIVVKVVEPVPGDWQMLSSSHEHTKGEAFAAEFLVPVKQDGEAKLAYRVRMRY
jgi:hypothetical protein